MLSATCHLSPAKFRYCALCSEAIAQRHLCIESQNGSYRPKTPLLQTNRERGFIFVAPEKHMGKDMVLKVGISQQSQQSPGDYMKSL